MGFSLSAAKRQWTKDFTVGERNRGGRREARRKGPPSRRRTRMAQIDTVAQTTASAPVADADSGQSQAIL
ncbi:MAG: hypothetical protein ACREP7_15175 [Lysobacter sp.]